MMLKKNSTASRISIDLDKLREIIDRRRRRARSKPLSVERVEHGRSVVGSGISIPLIRISKLSQGKKPTPPVAGRRVPKPGSSPTKDAESPRPASSEGEVLARIRDLLLSHLGSMKAVDAWLDSPDTGYPTTARDAIKAGNAEYVLKDLESQLGPNPSYA